MTLSVSVAALAATRSSGELHVLSSNVSRPAISALIPLFEKSSGIKVYVEYANNPILKKHVESGAEFDVVIIEPEMLTELGKARLVTADSVVALATIGMALVSRAGSPVVDIGSVESFKKVLLAADSIAYTADGHSGTVFLRTLEKIGLSDALKQKLVPVVGRPATLTVAEGGAQYTAVPLGSAVQGVQIAGQFPEELQTYIGISAAASSRAAAPTQAAAFLEYLQSASAKTLFRSKGFRPSRR
ncbi:MAG: substrate-binding domain-containing protein [Tepidisphaeraceae bacterium]